MTTHRAVVIKTMGDADFAGAIVDGISQKTILLNDDELSKLKAELAQIKAEKRKQDAKAGVRHNADEKRWAETKAELEATYADPPHSRLKTVCPKMGNDDDRADQYAVWLLDTFAESVRGLTNERGGIVRAGTGSAMFYIFHAHSLGATADGREAGVPLPANYAPSLNVKLSGPVSLIKSFTKPDLKKVINGGLRKGKMT